MALALDGSTPAFVTGTSNPVTTASFSPPANAMLVAFCIADEANTFVVANATGTTLTWTQVDSVSPSGFNSCAVWVAFTGGSAPGSISIKSTKTGSFTANGLKVAVITGAESSFTGAHGNTTNVATISLTATATGSWVWEAFGNQGGGTTDTAATGCTYNDAETAFGGVSGGIIRRTTADSTSGSGTAVGISSHNFSESHVAIEIKPGSAAAPSASLQSTSFHPGRSPGYGGARFLKSAPAFSASAGADQAIAAAGVVSAEAVGQHGLTAVVSPSGVATAEAVGAASVVQVIAPAGVGTAEKVGSARLDLTVTAAGVASAETVGAAGLVQVIAPAGIPSAETVSAAAISMTLTPAGVPSGEAIGQAALAQVISATGVPSTEQLGAAAVALSIVAAGVPSTETVGAAAITPGAVTLSSAGLPSQEVVGAASVSLGAPQTVTAAGVPSAERVGASRLDLTIAPASLASLESIGAAALTPGPVTITAAGLASGELVGAAIVGPAISAAGLGTAEKIGAASLSPVISGAGVTAGAIGYATVQPGPVSVSATGVVSLEAIGAARVALSVGQAALDPRLTIRPNLATLTAADNGSMLTLRANQATAALEG